MSAVAAAPRGNGGSGIPVAAAPFSYAKVARSATSSSESGSSPTETRSPSSPQDSTSTAPTPQAAPTPTVPPPSYAGATRANLPPARPVSPLPSSSTLSFPPPTSQSHSEESRDRSLSRESNRIHPSAVSSPRSPYARPPPPANDAQKAAQARIAANAKARRAQGAVPGAAPGTKAARNRTVSTPEKESEVTKAKSASRGGKKSIANGVLPEERRRTLSHPLSPKSSSLSAAAPAFSFKPNAPTFKPRHGHSPSMDLSPFAKEFSPTQSASSSPVVAQHEGFESSRRSPTPAEDEEDLTKVEFPPLPHSEAVAEDDSPSSKANEDDSLLEESEPEPTSQESDGVEALSPVQEREDEPSPAPSSPLPSVEEEEGDKSLQDEEEPILPEEEEEMPQDEKDQEEDAHVKAETSTPPATSGDPHHSSSEDKQKSAESTEEVALDEQIEVEARNEVMPAENAVESVVASGSEKQAEEPVETVEATSQSVSEKEQQDDVSSDELVIDVEHPNVDEVANSSPDATSLENTNVEVVPPEESKSTSQDLPTSAEEVADVNLDEEITSPVDTRAEEEVTPVEAKEEGSEKPSEEKREEPGVVPEKEEEEEKPVVSEQKENDQKREDKPTDDIKLETEELKRELPSDTPAADEEKPNLDDEKEISKSIEGVKPETSELPTSAEEVVAQPTTKEETPVKDAKPETSEPPISAEEVAVLSTQKEETPAEHSKPETSRLPTSAEEVAALPIEKEETSAESEPEPLPTSVEEVIPVLQAKEEEEHATPVLPSEEPVLENSEVPLAAEDVLADPPLDDILDVEEISQDELQKALEEERAKSASPSHDAEDSPRKEVLEEKDTLVSLPEASTRTNSLAESSEEFTAPPTVGDDTPTTFTDSILQSLSHNEASQRPPSPTRSRSPSPPPERNDKDDEEDPPSHPEPPSLTLALVSAWNTLGWFQRLPLLLTSVAINVALPFVNGVALGFGELFARNFINVKMGWSNPLDQSSAASQQRANTSTAGLGAAGRFSSGPLGGAGARTAGDAVATEIEALATS